MAILDCNAAAAPRPPCQEDQRFYFTAPSAPVKPHVPGNVQMNQPKACRCESLG